jgi:transposase InsO family protein
MSDFTQSNDNNVVMTGAGALPVKGYGTCAVVDHKSGHTFILHKVLYVPTCPVNIYSTTQLNQEGGTFTTSKTHAILTDHAGRTITTSKHYRHIYLLTASNLSHLNERETFPSAEFIALAAEAPDLNVWHKRFGHPGIRTLQRITTLKCVDGLLVESNRPLHECIGCITGKFRRSPFPTDDKVYEPLGLVHSDISGDYPRALNGHRYFTTLRDHATGYTLVGTHKHKSEAAEFLRIAILKLERESGLKIKCLRTDRGSEYMSNNMQAWLRDHGIAHQPTTIESSASNGVAERVNLTLMNRVRATLVESNQPRMLWPWALKHVSHALNFIPSGNQTKTPHELLFGSVPNVSHLLAFGAAVAAWTPLHRRVDKLVPYGDLGRFVGYTPSTKIFQV